MKCFYHVLLKHTGLTFLFLLIGITTSFAQEKIKYRKDFKIEGSLELFNSLNLTKAMPASTGINAICGVCLIDKVFVGLGCGYHYTKFVPLIYDCINIERSEINAIYIKHSDFELTADMQYRVNNIPKLRKILKPYFGLRLIFLPLKKDDQCRYANIAINGGKVQIEIPLIPNKYGFELSCGTEFVLKYVRGLYAAVAVNLTELYSAELSCQPSYNVEERKIDFKEKVGATVGIKIGMRL